LIRWAYVIIVPVRYGVVLVILIASAIRIIAIGVIIRGGAVIAAVTAAITTAITTVIGCRILSRIRRASAQ